MKFLPALISLCLASMALAEDPADPVELERLRQQWEKSVAQELEKKNKTYLKELEKLQKKFMGANKLTAANAINEEMQKVKAMKPQGQQKASSPVDGIWIATCGGNQYLRIFKGDTMLDINGERYKCTFKGRDLTVYFSSRKGHGEKYQFNPDTPNLMDGMNANGTKVTLERLKW